MTKISLFVLSTFKHIGQIRLSQFEKSGVIWPILTGHFKMKWTALRNKQNFFYLSFTYKRSLEWLVHTEAYNLDVLT